ncbi:hypothetical protein BGZ58_000589 [Dissophora ornata]|nr:hypothetical protein BGZ58_000589 [Dissophora ornata]
MWATRIFPGLVTLALAWMTIMMALALAEARPALQGSRKIAAETPSTTTNKNPKPAKQIQQKYQLNVLNPSPNDVWTSGMVETLSWEDLSLPLGATLDISLIPAEPETNPEAIQITRRPILRYIDATERYLDLLVPYDLVTREQLVVEQEGEGVTLLEEDVESPDPPRLTFEMPTDLTRTTTKPTEDIQSQARLYITAYEGMTNKMLVQVSVFPIEIRKDHARDQRSLLPPPVTLASLSPDPIAVEKEEEEEEQQYIMDEPTEDVLEKKDSDITHFEDNIEENGQQQDQETEGEGEDQGGEDEESRMLDSNNNGDDDDVFDMPIFGGDLGDDSGGQSDTEGGEEGGEEGVEEGDEDEVEGKNELIVTEMDMNEMDMTHEQHSGHGAGSDEDTHGGHDHSHVIDPNHFQNEEDVKIWKEHEDDPGYNPPIKVVDAGELEITQWVRSKVRLIVGAPYIFAWEFPDSGKDLTGLVNVYVEDVFTGKRYDIVAGNLPSEILFMYLHPSVIMMSASPEKRIYLRARVELDLFKDGDIHRYTGFSKPFWVERGAL